MATVVQTAVITGLANQVDGSTSLTIPATPGNMVVAMCFVPAAFSGVAFALYGVDSMTTVDYVADPWSGYWLTAYRVVTGAESSDLVSVDDNGAIGYLVMGLIELATPVTATGSHTTYDDFLSQDGVLPETVQVDGSFAADLNLHLLFGHYSSTAVLDWTTAGLGNGVEDNDGSSGNRSRAAFGTSLSATNPAETISGTVGAAVGSGGVGGAVIALTLSDVAGHTPSEPWQPPRRRRRVDAKSPPNEFTTAWLRH